MNTGTGPFDNRGAPDPSPFAGDDDPTPLERDYRLDHPEQFAHMQTPGLVPKGFDVDPPATPTVTELLKTLGWIESYVASTPRGQSAEVDHIRNRLESGS